MASMKTPSTIIAIPLSIPMTTPEQVKITHHQAPASASTSASRSSGREDRRLHKPCRTPSGRALVLPPSSSSSSSPSSNSSLASPTDGFSLLSLGSSPASSASSSLGSSPDDESEMLLTRPGSVRVPSSPTDRLRFRHSTPADDELWYFDCAGASFDAGAVADWHALCSSVFKDGELDDLACFVSALSHTYDHVSAHLYLCLKGTTVLGGGYYEYYEDCKSVLLAYIVVSPETRGMGVGKKLFDEAVRGLETCHPGALAMFVETHGMSVEDGIHSSAARQKYFADLGFQQIDVPYMTPILYGHDEPCYDYCLVVRPMKGAGLPIAGSDWHKSPLTLHVNMSLARSFLISYWDFASAWLFEDVEEAPHVQWLCARGYGDREYDFQAPPFLLEEAVDSEEEDDVYTPLKKTPWDMKFFEESLSLRGIVAAASRVD